MFLFLQDLKSMQDIATPSERLTRGADHGLAQTGSSAHRVCSIRLTVVVADDKR
jgi:hypothetical protein